MSQEIDSREESAIDKVFQIDWLHEEILEYLIFENNGEINWKMAKNLRLVQKSWLQTTTNLLWKSKQSVTSLTLEGNDGTVKREQLDKLVETFGAFPRLQESFLPVKLDLMLELFRERNYQSLSDCLTRLGSDLMELHVEYPKSGGTMPAIFPSFSFPYLRKLTFRFSDEDLKKEGNKDADGLDDNQNGLVLLSSILNASRKLKDLVIPYACSVNVVPMNFKYIPLPATISSLDLSLKLKSEDLELLLSNDLSNLAHLTLQLYELPFQNDLLFKILKGLQKSLQTLNLDSSLTNGQFNPVTYLNFPIMEKMKKLDISCTECELGPGNVSALQRCLPQLQVVQLYQTKARLAKWTRHSKFKNVERLTVSIVNEELDDQDDFFTSPDITVLTQLRRSFPNIWSLSLVVNINDITGLKYIFQNMAQLQELRICFNGNDAAIFSSSNLIDCTLLGLPLWMVVGLKNDRKSLEAGVVKGGIEPSIGNLSELDSLTLATVTTSDGNGVSLMSNLLFRHALVNMTHLENLYLKGRFQPTLKMEEEWEEEGRFIKYSDV